MSTMDKPIKDSESKSGDTNADGCAELESDAIHLEMVRQTSDDIEAVNNELQTTSDDGNGVPKDKGWAWFVMLGALLEMMLVIGILKTAGIIFVAFQDRFNSTSSMTSLLSTLQNATYSLTAPIVLCIGKRVTSSRRLLFIGTIILSTAYVITSQAKDIRILFFSHGILQGIGTAFMQPIAIVTLASYFDKKRGFANSLAVSGGSLGGLIYAPLYTYLLKEYGYQGCFLIIAAILMHGLVVGALFRPHSFYKNRRKTRTPAVEGPDSMEKRALMTQMSNTTSNGIGDEALTRKDNINGIHDHKPGVGSNNSLSSTNVAGINQVHGYNHQNRTRKRTTTETSQRSQLSNKHLFNSHTNLKGSVEHMCGSMMDINLKPLKESTSDTANTNKSDEEAKLTIKSMFKLLISSFEFKLFKNPIFCVLQLSSFLICGNSALLTVYIAPHARDMGIQVDDIALIVTVFSLTDFISRIVIALIVDRGWVRRSNITATAVLIVAIASNFMRFYGTFEVLLMYGVILGLFSGVYFSLFAVLIVDYLTIHKLQATFGFTSLFHGAGVSLFYYVIGYLRDVTGSYIIPFHLMGCLCFVGSMLHYSLPFVERYHKRKECRDT